MELLESHLETTTDEFGSNAAHHRALAAELKEKLGAIKRGGGTDLVERHRSRGKLFVRDRIEGLLDRDTRSSSSRRSPPTGSTTATRRAPGSSPGSASCAGARSWSWPTTPREGGPTTR